MRNIEPTGRELPPRCARHETGMAKARSAREETAFKAHSSMMTKDRSMEWSIGGLGRRSWQCTHRACKNTTLYKGISRELREPGGQTWGQISRDTSWALLWTSVRPRDRNRHHFKLRHSFTDFPRIFSRTGGQPIKWIPARSPDFRSSSVNISTTSSSTGPTISPSPFQPAAPNSNLTTFTSSL